MYHIYNTCIGNIIHCVDVCDMFMGLISTMHIKHGALSHDRVPQLKREVSAGTLW